MDEMDLFSLIDDDSMFSETYEVVERADTILSVEGIAVNESITIVESISFGERILSVDEIIEEYNDDLSWLL